MTPNVDLAALLALVEAATPGPWRSIDDIDFAICGANGELAVLAPALARLVLAQQAQLATAREALVTMGHTAIHVGLCGTPGPLIEPKDCAGCKALASLGDAQDP